MHNKLLLFRNIKVPVCFKDAAYHDNVAIETARREYNKRMKSFLGNAEFFIYKKSADARSNNNMYFIYTVAASPENNYDRYMEKLRGFEIVSVSSPVFNHVSDNKCRPVVAGFGPAGMFCAYALSLAGANPVVLERGSDADTRTEIVKTYWSDGILDPETNVQFGEGGAGTFSDGKLLTRISDPLSGFVLKKLVDFGAPKEILYLAKPHVGTDLLKNIVKRIRTEIENNGGKVMFNSALTGLFRNSDGSISSVRVNDSYDIECDSLFLCIGHSARDTFKMLMGEQVNIVPKPFSVGVRAEHLQEDITNALYGKYAGCEALEKAQYTLSHRSGDRGVYSFCMCPGGIVVASASDKDEIVTNGMSYYRRDGDNANSAIAVSVNPEDYGNTVQGAIDFQKNIERSAFTKAGGNGSAPIQLLGDFLNDSSTLSEPDRIMPTYTGKTQLLKIGELFPKFIVDMLKVGFNSFEKNIKGFSCADAVLTAPETRTSSPVRITRNDAYVSISCGNLYPCGEGAGYAGGITSAAVDGLRCAMSYLNKVCDL